MFGSRAGDMVFKLVGVLALVLVLGVALKLFHGLDPEDLVALAKGDLDAVFPVQIVAAFLTGTAYHQGLM